MVTPHIFARRAPVRTCNRYRDNGSACTEPTNNVDLWCRTEECPGHMTPAPDKTRFTRNGRQHHVMVNPSPFPLDEYEISTLHITSRALDRFLAAHPGFPGRTEAEISIKSMVSDFASLRRWKKTQNGYYLLVNEGFRATISRDLRCIIDYQTIHAERTWAQCKAGVPSRGLADKNRRKNKRRAGRSLKRVRHRLAQAEELGVSVEAGLDGILVTGPDSFALEVARLRMMDLAGPAWADLARLVRNRWGVDLEPIMACAPDGDPDAQDGPPSP